MSRRKQLREISDDVDTLLSDVEMLREQSDLQSGAILRFESRLDKMFTLMLERFPDPIVGIKLKPDPPVPIDPPVPLS